MVPIVTHRTRHLRLEQLRIVPEIPQQRVTEDDDPVMEEVPGDRVTLVEAVRAPTPRTLNFGSLPLYYLAKLDGASYYPNSAQCEMCKRSEPLKKVWV